MKTPAQIKFNEIIKNVFHENLKPIGFKKKNQNFYRQMDKIGHIINIQKSIYKSNECISFTVNVGIFSENYWFHKYNFKNEKTPPSYPTEPVSIIRERIGKIIGEHDKWYEIDAETEIEPIKSELTDALNKIIIPYFDSITNFNELKYYINNNYSSYDENTLKEFVNNV